MSNSNTNLQTQSSNALHNAIMEAGSKDRPPMLAPVPVAEGSSETTTERYMENYKNVLQDICDQLNVEAEAVQIILTGIDNDIYSTVDAYWEFGKFTSRDDESLESYYSRFYKMMNELVRNQCHVTNHQVNVQFLLQLQPEWQRKERPLIRVRNRKTFQTLKDKLCNAPVLALLDGSEDFVVYCDASGLGLGCVFDAKSDYDCKICYHPGKANVVANILSRNERVKPKIIRAINMTLQSSIKGKILAAQKEASDEPAEMQRGLDKLIERRMME
ncbi:gag-pol polyprotein [Tanacetum coccineum]